MSTFPAFSATIRKGFAQSAEGPGAGVRSSPAIRPAPDPWVRRARPTFLYVMYLLLLLSVPMGLLAAFRPDLAQRVTIAISAYLGGLPEPLYALFATGYLGYTAARQWGKATGTDQ